MLSKLINPCHRYHKASYEICMSKPDSKECEDARKAYIKCVDRQTQLRKINPCEQGNYLPSK